jgi:hypothetical protein
MKARTSLSSAKSGYDAGLMEDDEIWRWAEPDGTQRSLTRAELKDAFARGLLSTNTPVWRAGYPDWKPAHDVPELSASVTAGAKLVPAKGIMLPGRVLASGAFGGQEPPSPPAYAPVPKVSVSRPAAPALSFESDDASRERGATRTAPDAVTPKPAGVAAANLSTPVQKGAPTLIIHAGAPPAPESSPDDAGAPINVPSPDSEQSKGAITRPPPVHEGVVAVEPSPPPARVGKLLEEAAAKADDVPQPASSKPSENPFAAAVTVEDPPVSPRASAAPKDKDSAARVSAVPRASESQKAVGRIETKQVSIPARPMVTEERASVRSVGADKATADKRSPLPREEKLSADATSEVQAGMILETTPSKAPPPPKPRAKDIPPEPVSTSMILPDPASSRDGIADVSGPYAPVSTSMLLAPDSTPSGATDEVATPISGPMVELSADDIEPASSRTVQMHRSALSKPPPTPAPGAVRAKSLPPRDERSTRPDVPSKLEGAKADSGKQPSAADATAQMPVVREASLPPMRPRQPSVPPPLPLDAGSADETLRLDASMRMGLSRPPPPDIDPLAASIAPPDARRMPTIPPETGRGGARRGVPIVAMVTAVAVAAVGAFWVGRTVTADPDPSKGANANVPTISAPTVVMSGTPAGTTSGSAGSGGATGTKATSVSCKLTGSARPVAQRAMVRAGVDVVAGVDGIAIGYATSLREALAIKLDPTSLAPIETAKARSVADIRRVVPMLTPKLAAVPEFDAPVAGVSKRRTLPGSRQYIGVLNDTFVWGKTDGSPERVFAIAGGDIDALRGGLFGDALAYAYRQGPTIWVGTSKAGDTPQRIPSLGAQVGSPALATLEDSIIAAWADLAKADDPWRIRIVRHKPGSATLDASVFKPEGGLGGALLSPSLLRVSDDRVMLLWTEEGSRNGEIGHQVRAQLLDESGTPVGAAFVVSASDMNAGQAQAAIGTDGRGIIAFLSANGDSFDVASASFSCARDAVAPTP